jgi:hypothetical protein
MAKCIEGWRGQIYWPFPSGNAVPTGAGLQRSYRWIINSALLRTFGGILGVTSAAYVAFAQTTELCQERGKVGGVKQRFLAELNAPEVAPFDGSVE